MAWTVAQLEALEEAIAQGSTSVKWNDKTVVYRSLDEMLRIRDVIRKALYPSTEGAPGRVYPSFSKGLT